MKLKGLTVQCVVPFPELLYVLTAVGMFFE